MTISDENIVEWLLETPSLEDPVSVPEEDRATNPCDRRVQERIKRSDTGAPTERFLSSSSIGVFLVQTNFIVIANESLVGHESTNALDDPISVGLLLFLRV